MSLSKEDIPDFDRVVDEIIDIVNSSTTTKKYSRTSFELFQTLRDHDDGTGFQVISCVAIRSPIDNKYDLYLDVMGDAEEAVRLFRESIQKLVETSESTKPSLAKKDHLLN